MSFSLRKFPCHYGWVIVFSGILTLFACLGLARFAYGMLLPSMRSGLALGYDQMGYISTANFVGYLVSVALAPLLIRRLKPRRTIAAGLFLIALCMLAIGQSHSFEMVLGLYCLVGIGSGFANIPVMVLVSHWFRRERRGRAAGLMVIGNGMAIVFAGFLIPALNERIGAEGWRVGWMILGGMTLVVAAIAAILLRNDPAELGLEPVGRKGEVAPAEVATRNPPRGGRTLLKLGVLYAIFGATYMVYGTFIVTTMVVEMGFAEARAGMFWSWVGFFGIFSGVGFGALSDRIGRRRGMMVVFAVQTLAYLLVGLQPGQAGVIASVFLYGIAAFAIPTIMAATVGDYLGLSRAAAGFSTVTLFFAVGQTVGPGAAGALAEARGSLAASFLAAALLTALAVAFTLTLPRVEAER